MRNRRLGMERMRVEYPARYWTHMGKSKQAGIVVNVSPGGLFVHCQEPERQGQAVTLEVEVPGRSPIRLRGSVVWHRKLPKQFAKVHSTGFAIAIEHAPEEWFQQLAHLLNDIQEQEKKRTLLETCLHKRR